MIGYGRVSKTVVRLQISKSGGWSDELCVGCVLSWTEPYEVFTFSGLLTFKLRIKSRLPFAGIIRSSPYSTGFQDKG